MAALPRPNPVVTFPSSRTGAWGIMKARGICAHVAGLLCKPRSVRASVACAGAWRAACHLTPGLGAQACNRCLASLVSVEAPARLKRAGVMHLPETLSGIAQQGQVRQICRMEKTGLPFMSNQ